MPDPTREESATLIYHNDYCVAVVPHEIDQPIQVSVVAEFHTESFAMLLVQLSKALHFRNEMTKIAKIAQGDNGAAIEGAVESPRLASDLRGDDPL